MNHEALYASTLDFFLEPICHLRDDPEVTEIMINGPDEIFVEKRGRLEKTSAKFRSQELLHAAVQNMAQYVGRPMDSAHLTMDGRLPDGSRIHIINAPISRRGLCITIRKFRDAAFTLEELVASGSIETEAENILQRAIHDQWNVVVAGGTGTGKTSLLNALSREISPAERIVVIEESSELRLVQPHTIYLEAKPSGDDDHPPVTLRDLFVNALRMRPDRILIGEVRRGEALDMVQSMLSGHDGSLSTLHASSPSAAATRLETLCMMSDTKLPVYVARAQVAAAIDIFVQTRRLANGNRCVTHISRLNDLDERQAYRWEHLYERRTAAAN